MNKLEVLQAGVRPVVTILFAAGVLYGFVVGLIAPGEFMGMAGLAIGFYFQARQQQNGVK